MNAAKVFVASMAIALVFGSDASAQAGAPAVALKGYDVVAYFTESRASRGSPEYRHDWDGARYYFSSAKHRAAFVEDPDRYAPQFRSYCAVGIGAAKKVEADPTAWKIVDGRLYVFSSRKAAEEVEKDPDVLARSQQVWQTIK